MARKLDLIRKRKVPHESWREPTPPAKAAHVGMCVVIALNVLGKGLNPLALASGTRFPKLTIRDFSLFIGKMKYLIHIYDVKG